MKKIILASCLTIISGFCFSQTPQKSVGIGTTAPQGPLHVDAKKDTNGSANITDDVIIDTNGNLGIGTTTPTQKVYIDASSSNGNGFRLKDQSEGLGYLLMSKDDQGTATWIPKPFSVLRGDVKITGTVTGSNTNSDLTSTPLMLPPGVWMIFAKYALTSTSNSNGFYFWTYLHDLDGGKSSRNSANSNYYLNPSTSFQNALAVVGILPEQVGGFATTPTISTVTTITSPGKNPGEDGYTHEIRLTFSTSSGGASGGVNAFNVTNTLAGMNLGVYFYAIRLDIPPN